MKKPIVCIGIALFLNACQNESPQRNKVEKQETPVYQEQQSIGLSKKDQTQVDEILKAEGVINIGTKYAFVVYTIEDNGKREELIRFRRSDKGLREMQNLPPIQYDPLPAPETIYYASPVQQLDNYSEDVKYKTIDEFEIQAKVNTAGREYRKIVKRECFPYDTYEEASKAREKYIIN